MKHRYIYTLFVGSMYWKSFNLKKESLKELQRLKRGGVKNLKINKQRDDD